MPALNKPTEKPTPFEFFMNHPDGLQSLDVDVSGARR
jgi:hypothetical protein